jgi:hypothetical protein
VGTTSSASSVTIDNVDMRHAANSGRTGALLNRLMEETGRPISILDGDGTTVVRSRKQSFCIVPTDAVDLTVPGAVPQPWSHRLGSRCGYGGSLWVRTALAPGWADTYDKSLPCQWVDVTDLAAGEYTLRATLNLPRPDSALPVLVERDHDNNTIEVPVTIE